MRLSISFLQKAAKVAKVAGNNWTVGVGTSTGFVIVIAGAMYGVNQTDRAAPEEKRAAEVEKITQAIVDMTRLKIVSAPQSEVTATAEKAVTAAVFSKYASREDLKGIEYRFDWDMQAANEHRQILKKIKVGALDYCTKKHDFAEKFENAAKMAECSESRAKWVEKQTLGTVVLGVLTMLFSALFLPLLPGKALNAYVREKERLESEKAVQEIRDKAAQDLSKERQAQQDLAAQEAAIADSIVIKGAVPISHRLTIKKN